MVSGNCVVGWLFRQPANTLCQPLIALTVLAAVTFVGRKSASAFPRHAALHDGVWHFAYEFYERRLESGQSR